MDPKRFLIIFTLSILLLFGLWLPAQAAPGMRQQIPTPTAGVDGRIIYIVKAGDSCFVVAALNSITIDQLRQLNSKLDENCTITEGQELLIGLVSLAGSATPGPSPTPAAATATPTPFTGTTEICVLLFDDLNGNSLREETEPAIAGGAISVTENNGEYSASQQTTIPADPTGYQGVCFSNVPEGSYNITVGIPDNYNATVDLNYSLEVHAGDRAQVNFGAQSQDVVVDPGASQNPAKSGTSPWLGILGAVFLLGGGALGYYAWRAGKPESRLTNRGNPFNRFK